MMLLLMMMLMLLMLLMLLILMLLQLLMLQRQPVIEHPAVAVSRLRTLRRRRPTELR